MASGKYDNPKYVAQDILSRRDHSEGEMRKKLTRKGFLESDVNETIAWLYEQKLLDDKAFARRYVDNILELKPAGPRLLSQKLKQRGIVGSVAQEAIARAVSREGEGELVRRAAASWQRQRPKYAHDKIRLQRFLASRGFSSGAVFAVLDQLVTEIEDDEPALQSVDE